MLLAEAEGQVRDQIRLQFHKAQEEDQALLCVLGRLATPRVLVKEHIPSIVIVPHRVWFLQLHAMMPT